MKLLIVVFLMVLKAHAAFDGSAGASQTVGDVAGENDYEDVDGTTDPVSEAMSQRLREIKSKLDTPELSPNEQTELNGRVNKLEKARHDYIKCRGTVLEAPNCEGQ